MEKLLNLNSLKSNNAGSKTSPGLTSVSKRDIAVIGIAGRFASANNIDEYWEGLKAGKDFVRSLPEDRKKESIHYIKALNRMGIPSSDIDYLEAAFLENIDEFDCSFFNIPPKEAKLMDPNQRLLLEVIWEAVENAGYGGKTLSGSNTGVYVGFSSDFGEEYKRYIRMVAAANEEAAVTGNIKSIIGSRISYLLDLKGPSMVIDTACSSTLVAVHTACQALRAGDCTMAIAGSVKAMVAPVGEKSGLGIGSSTGRARTFDDSSDGTGAGEGVGALILKPLYKALEDGDNIYAVIKGSAANQDGTSVGITAPNMAAQEEVILKAWKDASIEPETITYIETHGTGTKLGDPIEIGGIKKAFENFTGKKQFCAVASVKSNVGHLDHAAGIAALVKAIMAVKMGEIPPTLHFQNPNRKINFEDSPVYVNNSLQKWETDGFPRRCGISSFGLSGTNCHIILEEHKGEKVNKPVSDIKGKPGILALSAKSHGSLMKLIQKYDEFLNTKESEGVTSLENICYTANTGRGHYNLRLALLVDSIEDLKKKIKSLDKIEFENIQSDGIFFSTHKIVPASKQAKAEGEISGEEKNKLSFEANLIIEKLLSESGNDDIAALEKLCSFYIKGADIEWEKLYQTKKHKKVHLPSYPFLKEKHWVEPRVDAEAQPGKSNGDVLNPLLEKSLVHSMGLDIFSTVFTVEKHWVLSEHKVAGSCVVPGTTYVELICQAASRLKHKGTLEVKEVIFLSPIMAAQGQEVDAQIIVKEDKDYYEFTVISSSADGEGWIRHAEGKFVINGDKKHSGFDIEELKGRFRRTEDFEYEENTPKVVETGPRFRNIKKFYIGEEDVLAYLELPEEYYGELEKYLFHPALLDSAVNLANHTVGEGTYLPLSYKNLHLYERIPGKIYSYISRKNKGRESKETGTFELFLMDEGGKVLAHVEEYIVKKVHEKELKAFESSSNDMGYYNIGWRKVSLDTTKGERKFGSVLILNDGSELSSAVVKSLKGKGAEVFEAGLGEKFERLGEHKYLIGSQEKDYMSLIEDMGDKLTHIIHMASLYYGDGINSGAEQGLDKGVFSLYRLTRALVGKKAGNVEVLIVSNYANEVTKNEKTINPQNAALAGFGSIVPLECPNILCRFLDIDESVNEDLIIKELEAREATYISAYRNGTRYVREFQKLDLKSHEESGFELRNGGTYVITGGAGGIGLALARHLSSGRNINLCLIGRSKLPERSNWGDILERKADIKLCRAVESILDIEKSGSKVSYYNADISDRDAVGGILEAIRRSFGPINGIIHAAGVAGDGFIIKKDFETMEKVIRPKILGTSVLDKLTEGDDLDFFVLCSSISSLMPAPGQSDYTAANAYLDSFARYRCKKGKLTLSINWPAWKETGMAVDFGAVNEKAMFKPVSNIHACRAFDELLKYRISGALPAALNFKDVEFVEKEAPFLLAEDIKKQMEKAREKQNKAIPIEGKDINNINIVLKGKIGKEYSETERNVGKVWALVLGVSEADIYDNFSDMGGDSILSANLMKEMQKIYPGVVDISDVFTYSTISDMAAYIDSKTNKKKEFEKIEDSFEDDDEDDDDFDDVLKKLASGNMSVDEAKKLIDLGDEE